MSGLTDVLGRATHTKDGIPIYPVQIKNWDMFEDSLQPLLISSENFGELGEEYDLFTLIIATNESSIIQSLEKVLSISTRESFSFFESGEDFGFYSDKHKVDSSNFEEVKQMILDRNLIFPPKVYKDPMVRKFAEKKIKQIQKNSPNVTLEDMISTVVSQGGKHPWEVEDYSIYQVRMEFNRICQWQQWLVSSLSQVHTETKLDADHFGETIDLRKDPYEDLFKDGAKNIKKALK